MRIIAWIAAILMFAFALLFALAGILGNVSISPEPLMTGMEDFTPGQPSVNLYSHPGCRSYYEPPVDYGFIITCTNLDGTYFDSATATVSYETGLITQMMLMCGDSVTVGDVMLTFPGVHRGSRRSKGQAVSIWSYGSAVSYVRRPAVYGPFTRVSSIILKVK